MGLVLCEIGGEMRPAVCCVCVPDCELEFTIHTAKHAATKQQPFKQVSQSAIRAVANDVFAHLLALDLRFHVSRQTGALSRVVDRGARGINWTLSSMVFNVAPTIFEVGRPRRRGGFSRAGKFFWGGGEEEGPREGRGGSREWR